MMKITNSKIEPRVSFFWAEFHNNIPTFCGDIGLVKNGIINQWYGTYFSASYRSSDIENSYGKFNYRKLSEKILNNNLGIINKDRYFIASTERAICGYFYKVGFQQLDDLDGIDRNEQPWADAAGYLLQSNSVAV